MQNITYIIKFTETPENACNSAAFLLILFTSIFPWPLIATFPLLSRQWKHSILLFYFRRSYIVEDIMAQQHDVSINANDSEEGAKIFRILETSAEPELLMADMSSEQLMSFSTYQSKQEVVIQKFYYKLIF